MSVKFSIIKEAVKEMRETKDVLKLIAILSEWDMNFNYIASNTIELNNYAFYLDIIKCLYSFCVFLNSEASEQPQLANTLEEVNDCFSHIINKKFMISYVMMDKIKKLALEVDPE